MKINIFLILIVFLMVGCQKKNVDLESEEVSKAIKKGRDTVFVDENGKEWILNFNEKVEDIDNSINGVVKYSYPLDNDNFTYDINGNVSKSVYKDLYVTDKYKIYIYDDSLYEGETFKGVVWVGEQKYRLEIEEPIKQSLHSDTIKGDYNLDYVCKNAGEFLFKGKIIYDSEEVFPFEYKFLVRHSK